MRTKTLRLVAHSLIIFCCSLLLTLVVLPPVQELWSDSRFVITNLLPIGTLMVLIYCACGRVFSSAGFVSLLVLGIRYLHDKKIAILEAPLISSDFLLWSQVFASPGLVLNYIGWPIALCASISVLALVIIYSFETPIARVRNRTIVLVALLLLIAPFRTTVDLYYTNLPQKPWEPDPSLRKVGVMGYLFQDYLLMKTKRTPIADASTIAATKKQYRLPDTTSGPGQNPDIILFLSESFIDPRILKGIDSCEQIPTFCDLTRKNFSGFIRIPAYGGETVRTEFEVLTGVPMTAVAEHYYPYMSLTNVPVNSIAWALREQGYETVAVHNHQRRFWRRPVAFKNLGFQRWMGVEDMKDAKLVGKYHADSMLTDTVIGLLNKNSNSSPQFVFAISMQAHGPYGKQPQLPEDQVGAIAVPRALQEKNIPTLQQFFYHLNSSDKELNRLASYIESRERPTLVLYFGDHLPGMSHVYYDLGFDNGKSTKQQKTPFLLFANYPLKKTGKTTSDLAAWQLATLTLKSAGLLGDGVFAWFNVLYERQNWSQEAAMDCQTSTCDALRQFQYLQLAGPESKATSPLQK